MKKVLIILSVLVVVFGASYRAGAEVCDNSNILDLELTAKSYESVKLSFTVPCGGDAWPVSYAVRYNINEITFGRRGNWRYSTSVENVPVPGVEGEKQSIIASNLYADIEYYFAIVTTFSDGLISYSISPSVFTLAEGQILITLKWDPPTTNEDGSPLTDLAGYKMYYGPSSRNYLYNMDLGLVDGETISFIIQEDDFVCYAVTAYDNMANESDYSNEVCEP